MTEPALPQPVPEPKPPDIFRVDWRPWVALAIAAGSVFVGWAAAWTFHDVHWRVWRWLHSSESYDDAVKGYYQTLLHAAGGSVAMQLMVVVCVVLASLIWSRGREPLAEQLGLKRARIPLGAWPVLFAGTGLASWIGWDIASQLRHLDLLPYGSPIHAKGFARLAASDHRLVASVLVSIAAGVGEEIGTRGFLQRRLMRYWRPLWAILLTTAFFSACHLDPSYLVSTFVPGLWFAYIAWRADSILPAMFVHGALDTVLIGYRYVRPEEGLPLWFVVSLQVTVIVGAIASVVILERAGKRAARDEAALQGS